MDLIRRRLDPSVVRFVMDPNTWESSPFFEIHLKYDKSVTAKDVAEESRRASTVWPGAPVFEYVDVQFHASPFAFLAWSEAWESVVGFKVFAQKKEDHTSVYMCSPLKFFEAVAGRWRGAGDQETPSSSCIQFLGDMIRVIGTFRPELRPARAAFMPEEGPWPHRWDAHGVVVDRDIAAACGLPYESLRQDYGLVSWADLDRRGVRQRRDRP